MSVPLRVLIIDDSKDDTLLLLRELLRGGYDPAYERVDTSEALSAALDKRTWDIIISDYVLPRFSGLGALKLMQEKRLDLPFIMVSGKMGEETAVEVMKAGAHDYILKQNLARLIPAIGRELGEAEVRRERKRAEDALQKNEEKYRTIVETTREGIWTLDAEARTTYVNSQMAAMLGYSVQEMLGRSLFDFMDDTARVEAEGLWEERKQGISRQHEFRFRLKDGSDLWTIVSTNSLFDEKGQLIGALGMITDITNRKRAEEQLRKTNRMLTVLSAVNQTLIRATNESTLVHDACRIIVEIGGYRMAWIGFAEHDKEKTVRPVCAAGHDEGYLDAVKFSWADTKLGRGPTGTAIRTGKPAFCGNILTDACYAPWREEATKRGYASSIVVPLANGRILGAVNLYSDKPDISETEEVRLLTELAGDLSYGIMALRIREERTRAEEMLRQSEQRLRLTVDQTPLAVIEWDTDFKVVRWNLAAERIFGYSAAEAVGQHASLIVPDGAKAVSNQVWRDLLARKGGTRSTCENVTKDGQTILCEWYNTLLITADGTVIGVASLVEDVTEHKMMEEHKRDFYRRTIVAATEGKLIICDRDEIERMAGSPIVTYHIRRAEDVGVIRRMVVEAAQSAGMDEPRICDLVLCVGESTTNAVKHAGGGAASVHKVADRLLFVISDEGPGIAAINLPEVALKRGYTTAISLGMGYKAMISIADQVYLATGPGGTTVGIEMKLHPAETPSILAGLPDTWANS